MFESILEVALSSGDVPELKSTQDIDKYADFIITAISPAVDKAIPTSRRQGSHALENPGKVLDFFQSFPDLEKSWKNEIFSGVLEKSWKIFENKRFFSGAAM